jgi:hypothetical protein
MKLCLEKVRWSLYRRLADHNFGLWSSDVDRELSPHVLYFIPMPGQYD